MSAWTAEQKKAYEEARGKPNPPPKGMIWKRGDGFRQDIADYVCEQLARGVSLNRICAQKEMPSAGLVRYWVEKDTEGFFAQYARARRLMADHFFDENIEIADECVDAAKARLQIDTRKWTVSQLAPDKYSEKRSTVAGDPNAPLVVRDEISDEMRARALFSLLQRLPAPVIDGESSEVE